MIEWPEVLELRGEARDPNPTVTRLKIITLPIDNLVALQALSIMFAIVMHWEQLC